MPPKVGARLLAPRLALLLCASLGWLLLLEVSVRVWRSSHAGPTTHPGLVRDDPVLGWRLAPNACLRHRSQDFDVEIRTDARGQRDLGGDSLSARLWWCGDSLAFGWGVTAEATCAARVAATLGEPVRVLAVSGYGTDQEYLRFLEVRETCEAPSDVVVVACENDVVEVVRSRMYGAPKPRFHRDGGTLVAGGTAVARSFLEAHSALARFVHKRLDPPAVPSEEEAREGRALVGALLGEWSARCRKEASGFLVVVTGEGTAAAASVLDPAEVLDVRMRLEEAAREAPVVFAHDAHWNERGHRVVAEAVVERLRELRVRREADAARRN